MAQLNDFHYAYILADLLYGVEMDVTVFEELGLIAWNYIGNRRTRIYTTVLSVDCEDNSVQLPCNAEILDAVTSLSEDYQYSTSYTEYDNYDSRFAENYIESRKFNKAPMYTSGGFVKYTQSGNTLYIDKAFKKVRILYRGVESDEDGLPQLTDKEAIAIATYVAFITTYKKGLVTQNSNIILMAGVLKADWEKKCDAARVKGEIWSQNEMDTILDAKTNWNRKQFGKSYKPFR